MSANTIHNLILKCTGDESEATFKCRVYYGCRAVEEGDKRSADTTCCITRLSFVSMNFIISGIADLNGRYDGKAAIHTVEDDSAKKHVNSMTTVIETTDKCSPAELNNFVVQLNNIFKGFGTIST